MRRACLFVGVCLAVSVMALPSAVRAEPLRPPFAHAQTVGVDVHDPPVDAPVIDPFRPPENAYSPGNRGLEYDTSPGQEVRASAGGVVAFAGQVGGSLFVTISHSATLKTTVGFVDQVLVGRGERVAAGQPIAVAGHTMHFTARRNGVYFDPETLFVRYRTVVRLVE